MTVATEDFAGLRIGLVGPLPPPAGGMAMQTRQLAERLHTESAQVEIVQTNRAYRPAAAGRVPIARAMFRLLPYLLALWRAAGRADLVHVMANSGWSWHLFAVPAIWIGWLRGRPVVVNFRGGEAASFLSHSGWLVRFTMRRCARLVVPSGFLDAVFTRHGMRASVVPNVVDTGRFSPPSGPAQGNVPQLLVARNLEAIYGNDTALRAFALVRERHPAARLVVAGSGPLLSALQALADELGVADAVRFTGRVDREEMADLLRRSAVAVNPSHVDNMPNSVLEALAAGVPVVSTDVGGVPYIVRDGQTALLVPARDERAMAAAIVRLLDDPRLAAALSAAGQVEAERYTWSRVAPQWAAVYREAVGHRKAHPVVA
jgi:glycosyltransferase involved in cell wall biosynthesis